MLGQWAVIMILVGWQLRNIRYANRNFKHIRDNMLAMLQTIREITVAYEALDEQLKDIDSRTTLDFTGETNAKRS